MSASLPSSLSRTLLACCLLGSLAAEQTTVVPIARDRAFPDAWGVVPGQGEVITYYAKGADGYYDVHTMAPDGSRDRTWTEDPRLPNRHAGNGAWHPSGRYLVFAAEKAEHPGGSFEAIPGFSAYNDLWAIAADRSWVRRLTDLPATSDHGTMLPHFSPDGRRLVWTERIAAPNIFDPTATMGLWVVKVADLVDAADGPRLANVRTWQPGGKAGFYECYGFSPDGRRLIFCSSCNQPSVWSQQIFTVDAATGGDLRQLTDGDYNEHAFYRPDGASIVWMTNRGSTLGGTDWWMMNADGSGKRRLTRFNLPGDPQCNGSARWAGLGSFSPDGTRFAGGIQDSLLSQEGSSAIVSFREPIGSGTGLTGGYFQGADLTGHRLDRVDPTIDFSWPWWTSPAPAITAGSYSERWTGRVQAGFTERYTFTTRSDDGVRLRIDGRLLVDHWNGHGATDDSASIGLVAGRWYDLALEHYEGGWGAEIRLSWSSPSQPLEIVPQYRLSPTAVPLPTGISRRVEPLPAPGRPRLLGLGLIPGKLP